MDLGRRHEGRGWWLEIRQRRWRGLLRLLFDLLDDLGLDRRGRDLNGSAGERVNQRIDQGDMQQDDEPEADQAAGSQMMVRARPRRLRISAKGKTRFTPPHLLVRP